MFFRTVLKNLNVWRNSDDRKPLVLRGARQVGKTTIVDEFGKEFPNYLKLNLEHQYTRELFDINVPIKQLVEILFSQANKPRVEGDTLIFIDEIQNSPKAMSLLRYFYEELPEIHVIAAGSLLENVVDIHSSFPVGRVEYMPIRPCSFVEFLGAINESHLLDLIPIAHLANGTHEQLIQRFNAYTIVGGMPEAVKKYSQKRDILSVDKVFSSLLQGYRDDVEKYTRGKLLTQVVRYILNHGWRFAAERITLNKFASSEYSSKEVGEAFRLLQKAMLAELAYPSTSLGYPAIPNLSRAPKLLWLDTGLVNYHSGIRKEIFGATDITDLWRGRIGEQVVAQELLVLSDDINCERSFWIREKHQSSAEIDFLFNFDNTLIPIEVKTGHNAHLNSLHAFIEDCNCNVAVRVWGQPFSVDNIFTKQKKLPFTLINLPYYMIHQLPQILAKYVK